jgi:small subunit ribosomal protein S7
MDTFCVTSKVTVGDKTCSKMFSTLRLRQAGGLSRRLPQYARTFTTGIEDEKTKARDYLGVGQSESSSQQVAEPLAPGSPAEPDTLAPPPNLDDMHHHLPPEKHPMLHLIATYIMGKKIRKKPKGINEPYNKPFGGKYARAAKLTSRMLLFVQSSTRSPPMPIVQQAILDASPAVKCMRQKRGAKVIVKPKALNERQRVGKGIEWILDACRYRTGMTFPERLAQEILGVLQGDSKALLKKIEQHEFATVNRFIVDLCVNLHIRSHIH